MITVRPVADHELRDAVTVMLGGSLDLANERPNEPALYERALASIREEGNEVLVALDGDEVVGVTQYLTFTHLQHGGGRCCEIESVHVRADRRSQGIGAAILREVERRAREEGCYRIQLTSRNVRADAHRFYETNGYSQSHQGFKKTLN